MKNVFLCRLMLLTTLSCVFIITSQAATGEGNNNLPAKNVLMLGLPDNVRSNYFSKITINEKMCVKENMADKEYNAIIMENIMASANGVCKFIPACAETSDSDWVSKIRVEGEADKCYSDVSMVPSDEYRNVLDMAEAEYLLVLNQHYLKWQEKPMITLFHIVSYTLFDKDQNEVYRGNGYFSSMNLETPDKLRKISSRTSSRIASTITNQIK
jgi:hypothetical protein